MWNRPEGLLMITSRSLIKHSETGTKSALRVTNSPLLLLLHKSNPASETQKSVLGLKKKKLRSHESCYMNLWSMGSWDGMNSTPCFGGHFACNFTRFKPFTCYLTPSAFYEF